jgi:hypothetical protein
VTDIVLVQGDGEEIEPDALLAEFLKVREDIAVDTYARAELNERYVGGDQFLTLKDGAIEDIDDWDEAVPKLMRNHLPNLQLTYSARLTEDRPDAVAYPAEAGADVGKSVVANKLLLYQHQRHDFDALLFRAVQLMQPHSCVGLKAVWDPLKGPVDTVGYPVVDETSPSSTTGPTAPSTSRTRSGSSSRRTSRSGTRSACCARPPSRRNPRRKSTRSKRGERSAASRSTRFGTSRGRAFRRACTSSSSAARSQTPETSPTSTASSRSL